jgi:predicted nucleic acid-binding protein
MILVDTTVWVDFFKSAQSPGVDLLVGAIYRSEVAIGDLILVEVLQGVRPGKEETFVAKQMALAHQVSLCGPEIAPIAAANYRQLRRKGLTIRGTIDVVIATWCIENDVPLLHNDRDFDIMEKHLGMRTCR